jgi:hypothetical protein
MLCNFQALRKTKPSADWQWSFQIAGNKTFGSD